MDVKQYLLNTSESELCGCEVPKKAQKKIWGFNGIQTHNLH